MGKDLLQNLEAIFSLVAGLYLFLRPMQLIENVFKSKSKSLVVVVRMLGIITIYYAIMRMIELFKVFGK